MSAIAALKAARAAGLQLTVEGSDLVLEASAPPPSTVLSLLSLNKAENLAPIEPLSSSFLGPETCGSRPSG
jgi:hypothetical protein